MSGMGSPGVFMHRAGGRLHPRFSGYELARLETLTATQETYTWSNLNGDNDEGYEAECTLLKDNLGADMDVELLINGATTGLTVNGWADNGAGIWGATAYVARCVTTGGAPSAVELVIRLQARSGRRRSGFAVSGGRLAAGQAGIYWNNTADVITSLALRRAAAGVGQYFDVGSVFVLRRLRRQQ